MTRIELTQHLHAFFPQLKGQDITVPGDSVAAALQELEKVAPGIGFYICDEHGGLRRHVNIFINNHVVKDRTRLRDPLPPGSTLFIMQALSGG